MLILCFKDSDSYEKESSISDYCYLSVPFLAVVSPQHLGFAKAQREPATIGIGVQSPSGSYPDNTTIPLKLNVELVYGMTEAKPYNFSRQDIICKYSLDNGEWVNIPFIKTISSKVQWDLNFPYVNIIDCNYSTTLSGLSAGNHFINITAYPYPPDYFIINGNLVATHEDSGSFGPSQIYFTVYRYLSIVVMSPQNQTYHSNSLKLNSIVNQETSWIGYSIDHQANETILGNTTITGVSYGSHSLALYANGTFGNTGASQIIYFDVHPPEPFPTQTVIVAVLVVLAVMVVAGSLVYFKKRKH